MIYRKTSTLLAGLILGIMLTFVGGNAQADIIPDFFPTVVFDSGSYIWSWDVLVTDKQVVAPEDLFEIFDFDGFIAGSMFQPGGWIPSSPLVGPLPAIFGPDDPGKVNLTWTWGGPGMIGTGATDVPLGAFGARSTFGLEKLGQYAGSGTSSTSGLPHANFGPTVVPDAPFGGPSPVPEPCSMALLGCGALGVIGKLRNGRKQTSLTI